ncbi:hypothetical protein FRC02_005718 [Tulasnella sp. 418]|nr:hypothetical protein FRC02_005718 [Tulasnella sp. 418]
MDQLIENISSQAFKHIENSLLEGIPIAHPTEEGKCDASIAEIRITAEFDAFIAILEILKSSITQRIAVLRQKRNALASHIHGLPSELLSLIFEFAAESFPQTVSCSQTKRNLCSRLPHVLTTVCSRWREVAISTPRVWSHICNKLTSDEVQLYLDRSSNSPMDITYHDRLDPQFIPQVIPHLPRLRTLHTTSEGFIEIAEEELGQAHTPILESVYLTSGKRRTINHIERTQIFKHAPQLRKLEIATPVSISIDWEVVHSFSKLTYLKIYDLGEDEPEGSLIGSRYHRLFKSLPCLETAIIKAGQRYKPPGFSADAIGKHDTIIHHNLQFLSLHDISATLALTVASFLYSTSPHPTKAIFSECSMGSIDSETRILLPSGNFIENVVSQVRLLSFTVPPEYQNPNILIQGATSWDDYESEVSDSDPRYVLHLDLCSGNSSQRPFPPILSMILPTTETFKLLQTLFLKGGSSISLSDVDLPTRLKCLPSLQEIVLGDFSRSESIAELKNIFRCLGRPITDKISVEKEEKWICPNLSRIWLHKLALDVPDLLEMLRNRGMVDLIPDTPPARGSANPLELLVVEECCTFSNSSSCGELVVICNQQLAVSNEISGLVSYGECNCAKLKGPHTVIDLTQ